jgi:hypothetical protein
MPKYTLSAPALMAAASDSREPTGAIISKSFTFMGAKIRLSERKAKEKRQFFLFFSEREYLRR